MIKAIETRYKGYRFRSRLEARWAVFFDTLEIKWEYEPQGFVVTKPGEELYENDILVHEEDSTEWTYLPDFYLPDLGTWVEVKGSLDEVSDDYLHMIAWAVDWGGALPNICNSGGSTKGLLWLGSIPDHETTKLGPPMHIILQHAKAGWLNSCRFTLDGKLAVQNGGEMFDSYWYDAPSTIRKELLSKIYNGDCWHFTDERCPRSVFDAYDKARHARFEHGECG